jgi:thiamine kinase-like enzyme
MTLPENLKEITEIRVNQRFATYRAISEAGEPVFVKQVRHSELKNGLRREIYGMEKMTQLAVTQTFPFSVPRVIENGQDYLVTSWAGENTMEFEATSPDLAQRIEFMAATYAAIDTATELVHPGKARFGNNYGTADRLEAKLKHVDFKAYFEPALIASALAYIRQHSPNLKARFTHADLTPDNIIETEGPRILVDWESAGEMWPRFYDIVNFTHNKALKQPELTDSLKEVLGQTFRAIHSSPEDHSQQLNTIAAVRAVSSIAELMTEPDHHHNTQETMTSQAAHQITTTLEKIINKQLYI